jgi:hypothetical protein
MLARGGHKPCDHPFGVEAPVDPFWPGFFLDFYRNKVL